MMLQFPEIGLKASVGVFFLSAFFLAASYNATFAFNHPVNTAVLTCFITGFVSLLVGRFVPLASHTASSKRPEIPLAEQYELPSRASFQSPTQAPDEPNLQRNGFWWRIGVILALCCLRVESFRQVTLNSECVSTGYPFAIPLLISLYDYWYNQRKRPTRDYVPLQRFDNLPVKVAYSTCRRSFDILTQSHLRGVFAAALLTVGGYLAASFSAGSRSTYICPIVLHGASRLQTLRLANLFMDSALLIVIADICQRGHGSDELLTKRAMISLGACLIGIALIWGIIGIFVVNTRPEHAGQLFLDARYSRSALGEALLAVFLVISAWYLLPYYGALGISMLGGFMFVYISATSTLLLEQMPFPHIPLTHAATSLIASTTGAVLFLLARLVRKEESKPLYRANIALQILFAVMCGVSITFASSKHRLSHTHPIDILIHKGGVHHDGFLAQAGASKTLEDAIMGYQKRYRQHPPPGFDKWYEYAVARSSVVIDDFDTIYDNLLPFRAISPNQIREMTQRLATNSFNDLGAISIRDGKAHVQKGIKPTHAWMVQGAAEIIGKFSEHLPDMDIVLNLNDEPRVAVPWEKLIPLKQKARTRELVPENDLLSTWSVDRRTGWQPIEPADQTNETLFTDGAWRGIFDPYVSAVCPPSSRARTRRIWNRHDICLDCAAPHSMGQFPIDFKLASDICHQPDLAFLHGLLISPASFKVSQDLVPVFSQSALSGFNDILFPSPWNYMDKIKYNPSEQYPDPEYDHKENSLYWVGSTSEGYSRFNEWKGMPRQRFAHMVNNNTYNQVSVLLPVGPDYKYQIMDGSAPLEQLHLHANVHISDPISRCGDCDVQHDELGTIAWVDFQNHWSHRFLFDLDGAGFSGRFLPFLQSHSLPLKTGLFRQWFDSRMSSWLHFVPVDIRLHGLWSTLAYFAGVSDSNANEDGSGESHAIMKAHTEQGRWIAEQGRNWAEVALRKEDMEIYFFRLLLEWGRLTDDQRDLLGYKPMATRNQSAP